MEVKRGQDFNNPGSQDQDPIFSNYRLPKHEARPPRLPLCRPLRPALVAMLWVRMWVGIPPCEVTSWRVPCCRSATRAASSRLSSPATWRS